MTNEIVYVHVRSDHVFTTGVNARQAVFVYIVMNTTFRHAQSSG
jgi:hypothetical protein